MAPPAVLKTVSWYDLSGGPCLYRIRGPEDLNRTYWGTATTRLSTFTTLGPLVTQTTSLVPVGGSPNFEAMGELPSGASSAGEIYVVTQGRNIFKYNNTLDVWAPGGPRLTIHACDAAWDESVDADVTVSVDTSDKKEGTGANQFVVVVAASAGDILATDDFAAKDLSTYDTVDFWIKCSVNTSSGDLQLLLDDTASCASPLETLDVPALTADTWLHCRVALAAPGSDTAIISVGLKYTTDIGACTIKIDGIIATKVLTSRATDVCNALVNDVYYLVFACNNANTVWSSDGSTWTDNAQDSLYVCAWNDQLWGITSAGQLWYTADMSTFTNDAVLPTGAGSVKALFTGPDAYGETIIYVLTVRGLYRHDFANAKFWDVGMRLRGNDNVKPVVHAGEIVIAALDRLWFYNPRTGGVRPGGPFFPDRESVPNPDGVAGNIVGMASDSMRLYVLFSDSSVDLYPSLAVSDGRGWEGWYTSSAGALGGGKVLSPLPTSAYGADRVWFPAGNSGATVGYVPLPSPLSLPANYAASSVLYLPWFVGTEAGTLKRALRVHIRTAGCTSTETIVVRYGTDFSGSAGTPIGTISGNGRHTLELPNSQDPTGIEFYAWRFEFAFARGSTTTSHPVLKSIMLEYEEQPLTTDFGWRAPA